MNGLSWLIYLASLSDGASTFFGLLSFMAAAATIAGTIMSIMWTDGQFGGDQKLKGYEEMRSRGKWLASRSAVFLLAFGIISVALPPKNTVYAIAASEVGGRVVQSQELKGVADDSLLALRSWIKKQIEPGPKK